MSNPPPASIRLFLAEGTPDGLWVVEKSNWTGVALMAPRSRYGVLRARSEMNGPGVYLLTGPAESGAKSARIYVGETDVLRDRLDNHQANKDFWTKAIVFTAKDENLNKAHVRYLESRLLQLAAQANRAELDNSTASALPALSEADRADVESFLADMLLIYPVLGVNAFDQYAVKQAPLPHSEPMIQPVSAVNPPSSATLPQFADVPSPPIERLYLRMKDTRAEGCEMADGFVVFKDSLGRLDAVPSIHAYGADLREALLAEGIFVRDGDNLRLTQDQVFTSPSNAAMVMLGRTSNGRKEWKNASGVSLKELQERALRRRY